MIATVGGEAVLLSLDLAAEAGGDLTERVYAKLFARHPEMAPLFVRDGDGQVRGEMLAKVFEMVLDYVGAGGYAEFMVRNEVVTHQGYDVPADVFPIFFEVVAETVREAAISDWTPTMDAGWAAMLADFRRFAAHG